MPDRLILLLLLLSALSFAQAQPGKADSLRLESKYQAANEAISAFQFDAALRLLSECYIRKPKETAYLLKIGYCHSQLGRYPDARLFYEAALKEDTANTTALSALGQLYEQQDNYRKAQSYFARLISIDSTNSYYYKRSARLYLKQGDATRALLAYLSAHTLNATDIEVITQLSSLYLAMEDTSYAGRFIDEGLRLAPNNIRLLQVQARLLHKAKQHSAVAATVQRTLELGDSSSYYIMLLGVALLHLDSTQAAIRHLESIVDRKEDNEHTHHYLGLAYRKLGRLGESAAHFNLALDKAISPKTGDYYYELGQVLDLQGQLKPAIDAYTRALDFGAGAEARYFLARAADRYYKDKTIALQHYQRYLASDDSAFREYSSQRARELKEALHFQQ